MWKSGRNELGQDFRYSWPCMPSESFDFYVKYHRELLKNFKLNYDMIKVEISRNYFLKWRGWNVGRNTTKKIKIVQKKIDSEPR